jgi:hypothetical protein
VDPGIDEQLIGVVEAGDVADLGDEGGGDGGADAGIVCSRRPSSPSSSDARWSSARSIWVS